MIFLVGEDAVDVGPGHAAQLLLDILALLLGPVYVVLDADYRQYLFQPFGAEFYGSNYLANLFVYHMARYGCTCCPANCIASGAGGLYRLERFRVT